MSTRRKYSRPKEQRTPELDRLVEFGTIVRAKARYSYGPFEREVVGWIDMRCDGSGFNGYAVQACGTDAIAIEASTIQIVSGGIPPLKRD